MGLFGFGKKKDQQPAPTQQPAPKPVEISGKPYEYYVMVDGQWHINPNYDPKAPKPEQPRVIGLDPDDNDEERDEEDDD